MAVPDDGFKVNVGGHLIEDPGSGLTKVFEHGATSAEMPVWDHEKQARGSARDRYSGSKAELKKVIKTLIDTPARGPGTGARPSWPITRRCSQGTQSTWTGPFGTSGTGPPYRPCHRRPTRPCGGRWAVAEAVGVTLPVRTDGGPEVFRLLGMIAARTSSIRIGSGIVGCYARPRRSPRWASPHRLPNLPARAPGRGRSQP